MKKKASITIKTLTLDNGVAFSAHEAMEQHLNASVYFCDPYKSYQKGAIENAHKLLRTKLAKRCKIDNINQTKIDASVKNLNNRPMKCLNFKTPNEVFCEAYGLNGI